MLFFPVGELNFHIFFNFSPFRPNLLLQVGSDNEIGSLTTVGKSKLVGHHRASGTSSQY